jgi:catechol 2,3-dioxygenase-like lactoylglutathione lyase family enzyme
VDVTFIQVVPIFRIFSEAKAKEFYVDFLGFTLDWEHRFEPEMPLYMQVSRIGFALHLSEHHGDGSPGATAFVYMTGIDAFHAEISGKGYRHLRPGIEDTPWDSRMMTVIDPFGNRIRFSEANR